jgi:hypothetical protein
LTFDDGYGTDPTEPFSYAFESIAPLPEGDRGFDIEVGVRLRSVSIPASLLDIWYFDADDPDWAWTDPRPRIRGPAFGLETVIKNHNSNGFFYVEFVDSEMPGGYWDDVEEPADHLDGDFLVPSKGTSMVAFGANYAYEAHLLPIEKTEGRFGLSFLAGGGIGMGVLMGRLDTWSPDGDGNPAYKRWLDGLPPDSDKRVPRVYPMVDITGGLRFNLGDRVMVRAEGGLHTMLYYGTSLGVVL